MEQLVPSDQSGSSSKKVQNAGVSNEGIKERSCVQNEIKEKAVRTGQIPEEGAGSESTDNLEDGILVRYSPLLKLAGYTGRQVLQTLNG